MSNMPVCIEEVPRPSSLQPQAFSATRGSDAWRKRFWGEPCRVDFARADLNGVMVAVERECLEAYNALGKVFRANDYVVRSGDTGSYNCRTIGDSNISSSHAWALSVDVNWHLNPQRRPLTTNLPSDVVRQAKNIKTRDGIQVFRWGGDFTSVPPDPMHFEIRVTPDELSRGLSPITVPGGMEEEEMKKRGDDDLDVAYWQYQINQWVRWRNEWAKTDDKASTYGLDKLENDGIFGEKTEGAVKYVQRNMNLEVTGTINLTTGNAILHDIAYHRQRVHSFRPHGQDRKAMVQADLDE